MPSVFTRYQKFVVLVLAFLQFTIILDFMIISPLGALLLRELDITTRQFGLVVSVYAFSAAASGVLAAGFADKFDRKRLLLFFYAGFLLGTLLCAVASSYAFGSPLPTVRADSSSAPRTWPSVLAGPRFPAALIESSRSMDHPPSPFLPARWS